MLDLYLCVGLILVVSGWCCCLCWLGWVLALWLLFGFGVVFGVVVCSLVLPSVVVWVCFVLELLAVAFVVFINCCGLADFFLRGFVRVRLVV